MKKLITVLFIPSVLVSTLSHAQNGYNASVYGGVDASSSKKAEFVDSTSGTITEKLKNSPMFGVSYGYNYKGLTLDISYENHISELKNTIKQNDRIIAQTGLIGLTYNINNSGVFRPYIGVGAGVGQMRIKSDFNSNDNLFYQKTRTSFAYQGKAGVTISVSKKISIFADARFTQIVDKPFKGSTENTRFGASYTTGVLGITYNFGTQTL